jgi:hypothetical protein
MDPYQFNADSDPAFHLMQIQLYDLIRIRNHYPQTLNGSVVSRPLLHTEHMVVT